MGYVGGVELHGRLLNGGRADLTFEKMTGEGNIISKFRPSGKNAIVTDKEKVVDYLLKNSDGS